MKKVNPRQREIGVYFPENSEEAHICVWAPMAKSVQFVLEKDGTKHPLEKDNVGYWNGQNASMQAGDRYTFLIDGDKERPDPCSLYQPEDVHSHSEVVDIRQFRWTDQQWTNPSLDQYFIYEAHCGTFTSEGTFKAMEGRLGYLRELGITAIEVMPVAQFPGNRNWGYDGVLPFAVQNSYGGPEEFSQFVDACHQHGIAVVLDVVYNHFGPEGNYFEDFGPYFTEKYSTPWGKAINFDDAWCDGVRHFFIENALMWFRDFHVDALRLDAVHAIKDFSAQHWLRELKIRTNELMEATGRRHHLIVELDLNDNRFINPLEKEGFGMDAQWVDEFHHALRVSAGQEKRGYYSDFNGVEHLAKSYKDAYVYDHVYSPHRLKTFGTKAEGNPGNQFIVFSQNHDQVGNRMLGERSSTLVSFEMQKLFLGAVMVSPYIPMLFMGEEYGETNPFQYFVSHTDKALGEAVRKGRKEEFSAFHDPGEVPDPMDESTFLNSKLDWEKLDQEPHARMLAYYKALIKLRKSHPVLTSLNRNQVEVSFDTDKNTLSLSRGHESNILFAFMNFSRSERTFQLPSGQGDWHLLLNSALTEWNGPLQESGNTNGSLLSPPESIIIYSK